MAGANTVQQQIEQLITGQGQPPNYTDYGPLGSGPVYALQYAEFGSGAFISGNLTAIQAIPPDQMKGYSGVYQGSLSAQGNLVAMQLNFGNVKLSDGTVIDSNGNTIPAGSAVPWATGYFRTYWKDPRQCVFGADSAIPAITAVMPASITDLQGNFLYYMDLQLTRVTGSNYFNTLHFINVFNEAFSWVTTSNQYIAALVKAKSQNLAYYNAKSYQDLITQGWATYQTGNALIAAFNNIGFMPVSISTGNFGTANAVAKTLIDLGLGAIGGLTNTLIVNNVNPNDIYNPIYTPIIAQTLGNITNSSDLQTIQEVIKSKVPNMVSPLDYTSISSVSGMPNDSAFADFSAVGADMYQKAPNFNLIYGPNIAKFIGNIQGNVSSNVEALATTTSLIPDSVIKSLESILPVASDDKPITMLNVIGAASGYLNDGMARVNLGLAELYATSYGPTIRTILSDISRYAAEIPLTMAEMMATNNNPNYWSNRLNSRIDDYYNTVAQAAADPAMYTIVNEINSNYLDVCQKLRLEVLNYDKANFTVDVLNSASVGTTNLLGFVSGIPSYGQDSANISSGYMLYGMSSNNVAGQTLQSLLSMTKNIDQFNTVGIATQNLL